MKGQSAFQDDTLTVHLLLNKRLIITKPAMHDILTICHRLRKKHKHYK